MSRTAARAAPNDLGACKRLGAIRLKQGRPTEALAWFDKALAANAHDAEALNNSSVAWRELKRYDQASQCAQRALAQNPRNADALNNQGLVFNDQGRHAEAEACFRQAVELVPRFALRGATWAWP